MLDPVATTSESMRIYFRVSAGHRTYTDEVTFLAYVAFYFFAQILYVPLSSQPGDMIPAVCPSERVAAIGASTKQAPDAFVLT